MTEQQTQQLLDLLAKIEGHLERIASTAKGIAVQQGAAARGAPKSPRT